MKLEALAFHARKAQRPMADHQRRHGQQPVQERHPYAAHGRGRQFGNHNGHHQLEGLQLPHLPLAHQPHGGHRRQKQNHRPHKNRQHTPPPLP